jgi:serine/threonine protein kinase
LTGKLVAIKVMDDVLSHDLVARRTISEIQILTQLSLMPNNHHTSKIHDIVLYQEGEDYNVLLVMDFEKSDLKNVLTTTADIEFTEDHVMILLYNTLCSLSYLHSAGVMHRDLKPANILMDDLC